MTSVLGRVKACGFALVALVSGSASLAAEDAIDGVWQTHGYGYIFHFQGEQVDIYERTAISCLPSALTPGKLVRELDEPGPDWSFPVSIPGFINADMRVITDFANERSGLRFSRSDTLGSMQAFRLEKLPELCSKPTDPDRSLAIFLQAFREHYPYQQRIGNWPEDAGDADLFDAMTSFLSPIKDPHTALVDPTSGRMFFGNEIVDFINHDDDTLDQAKQVIRQNYIVGSLTDLDKIRWGALASHILYLGVDGFSGFSESDNAQSESATLKRYLDNIMDQVNTKRSRAMIIDLRLNSGGSDKLALLFANRLIPKGYRAFSKRVPGPGEKSFNYRVLQVDMLQIRGRSTAPLSS